MLPDETEEDLPGITFCLYDADKNLVSADDFTVPPVQLACQVTGADGLIPWNGLRPDTYTAKETLPTGWFSTTGTEKSATLHFGGSATLEFANMTNCAGLTPGYWSNWRNHYTSAQFLTLLQGTIAEGDIAKADQYLASVGCDNGDALLCMRRFLLANQLTLKLTQHPELFNGGGSMYRVCQLPGQPDNLGYWLNEGLNILADPTAYTREYILQVMSMLDAFANMHLIYY